MKDVYKKIIYSLTSYILIIFTFKYLKEYVPMIVSILILYCATAACNKFLLKFISSHKKFITFLSLCIINIIIIFSIIIATKYIIIKSYLIKDGIMYLSHIYDNLDYTVLKKFQLGDMLKKAIESFLISIQYKTVITRGLVLTTNFLISYIMANIVVYFLISDRDKMINSIKQGLNDHIINNCKLKIRDMKKIIFIDFKIMAICTLITMLGFLILNIPYGVLLGILCGIFDILPLIGTFVIFIPLLIYYICIKNYIVTIGLVILFALIGIIRKILETKFLKNSFGLHPLIIILCVFVFTKNIGFIGVVLGSFYAILLKEIWENKKL